MKRGWTIWQEDTTLLLRLCTVRCCKSNVLEHTFLWEKSRGKDLKAEGLGSLYNLSCQWSETYNYLLTEIGVLCLENMLSWFCKKWAVTNLLTWIFNFLYFAEIFCWEAMHRNQSSDFQSIEVLQTVGVMIPAAEGTSCFALSCFVLTAHLWQNQKYLFSVFTLWVQQELNYQPAYCDCPRSIRNEQIHQGLHHGSGVTAAVTHQPQLSAPSSSCIKINISPTIKSFYKSNKTTQGSIVIMS